MALQYWRSLGRPGKHRLMTWRGGYHGDTFTPMSVCDPDGGMHSLWTDVLAQQVFAPQVPADYDPAYSAAFEEQLAEHADELAAVIVEPVVQGAGGMRFHDPRYLTDLREMCTPPRRAADLRRDRHRLRPHRRAVRRRPRRRRARTSCASARRSPAATSRWPRRCARRDIAHTISSHEPGALMHGPTFMANPLACAVAVASVELLLGQDWRARVREIEAGLRAGSAKPARSLPGVADVRVLGAIGVIEMRQPVDLAVATAAALDARRVAAPVPQPGLRDAAVHLHAGRDRADHLGDGRVACALVSAISALLPRYVVGSHPSHISHTFPPSPPPPLGGWCFSRGGDGLTGSARVE